MSKTPGKPSILTRRWLWMIVAFVIVFIAGISLGAAGHGAAHGTTCSAAGITHEVVGIGG